MSTPRRRIAYSQNFLRCPRLVDRLLARSSIAADDLVIEIGPGRGVITGRLARRCRQVLAVEQDPALGDELRARFAGAANVAVFAADFLDFPLPVTPYKVFASIPFNITAAIVGKLTSGTSPPVDAYLVVQREAAARFLGAPRQTLVAVLLRPSFEATVAHRFRPTDFAPAPAVDAVLLRLRRRQLPLVDPAAAPLFRDFASHVFTAWQPTVRAALAGTLSRRTLATFERGAAVDLGRPPASVPFADWLELFAAFRAVADERAVESIRGAEARLRARQADLPKVHRSRVSRRS